MGVSRTWATKNLKTKRAQQEAWQELLMNHFSKTKTEKYVPLNTAKVEKEKLEAKKSSKSLSKRGSNFSNGQIAICLSTNWCCSFFLQKLSDSCVFSNRLAISHFFMLLKHRCSELKWVVNMEQNFPKFSYVLQREPSTFVRTTFGKRQTRLEGQLCFSWNTQVPWARITIGCTQCHYPLQTKRALGTAVVGPIMSSADCCWADSTQSFTNTPKNRNIILMMGHQYSTTTCKWRLGEQLKCATCNPGNMLVVRAVRKRCLRCISFRLVWVSFLLLQHTISCIEEESVQLFRN